MIGEVHVFNLSAWNISISKFNINFCGWKAGHMEKVVVRSAWWVDCHEVHSIQRASVTAAMAILCTVIMNMKEAEWHSLGRSSSLLMMENYLWSWCLWGQSCGNKSSYSAYSMRLNLIPPPRPPSHQFSKSVFLQGLDQQRHYSMSQATHVTLQH